MDIRRAAAAIAFVFVAGCNTVSDIPRGDTTGIKPPLPVDTTKPPIVELDIGPDQSREIGSSAAFAAVARRQGETSYAVVRAAWVSRDSSVVSVDSTGFASFRKVGKTTIVATAGGVSDSAVVTVTVPQNLYITPDTNVIPVGMTRELHAQTFSPNQVIGVIPMPDAAWSSSNEAVARIDTRGRVTAVGAGTATITATGQGQTAIAQVFVVPNEQLSFTQVVTSLAGSCGLTTQGLAYCWGNFGYQADASRPVDRCWSVGLTVIETRPPQFVLQRTSQRCNGTPMLMSAVHFVRLIPTADDTFQSIFALTEDGQVYSFSTPGSMQTQVNVRALDVAVSLHACVIGTDHQLSCWGFNQAGELGVGTVQPVGPFPATPLPVAEGRTWSSVVVRRYGTCALDADGRAYCWGDNRGFRLGIGPDSSRQVNCFDACVSRPTAVATDVRFVSIATSDEVSCALTVDGVAYCWGAAGAGMPHAAAGIPTAMTSAPHFVRLVEALTPCGITATRAVYCLHRNANAATSDALLSFALEPLPFPVSGFTYGSVGGCAISATDRHTYCWGLGSLGRVGDGNFIDATEAKPALVGNQATP